MASESGWRAANEKSQTVRAVSHIPVATSTESGVSASRRRHPARILARSDNAVLSLTAADSGIIATGRPDVGTGSTNDTANHTNPTIYPRKRIQSKNNEFCVIPGHEFPLFFHKGISSGIPANRFFFHGINGAGLSFGGIGQEMRPFKRGNSRHRQKTTAATASTPPAYPMSATDR